MKAFLILTIFLFSCFAGFSQNNTQYIGLPNNTVIVRNSLSGKGKITLNDTTTDSHGTIYPVPIKVNKQSSTDEMFLNLVPWNYGVSYSSGYKPGGANIKAGDFSWGISPNQNNGGDGPPDNVFGFGYNIIGGTARKDTSDGAVNFAIETSFLNTLDIVEPNFEVHWPRLYRFDGTEQRVQSFYMGKIDGYTLWESNISDHQYKSPGNGWNYIDVSNFQGVGNGKIEFLSQTGYDFTGKIIFDNVNASTISAIADFDGTIELGSNSSPSEYVSPNGNILLSTSLSLGYHGSVAIGVDSTEGQAPDPSAILDIKSNDAKHGVLFPKLTNTQRDAISSPAEGLWIYSFTDHAYEYYNGTTWKKVTTN
jgi:hypothetical protein